MISTSTGAQFPATAPNVVLPCGETAGTTPAVREGPPTIADEVLLAIAYDAPQISEALKFTYDTIKDGPLVTVATHLVEAFMVNNGVMPPMSSEPDGYRVIATWLPDEVEFLIRPWKAE